MSEVETPCVQLTPKGKALCELWETIQAEEGRRLTVDERVLLHTAFDAGWAARGEEQAGEARAVAQEYYQDIRQLEGDYQWEKHYARDPEQPDRTWLKPVKKLGP